MAGFDPLTDPDYVAYRAYVASLGLSASSNPTVLANVAQAWRTQTGYHAEGYQYGGIWPTTVAAATTAGATGLPGAPLAGPTAPAPPAPYYERPLAYSVASLSDTAVGDEYLPFNKPIDNLRLGGSTMVSQAYSAARSGAIAVITRLALAGIRAHPVGGLLGLSSLINTLMSILGKSPNEYLMEQGLGEGDAQIGVYFLEFIQRALEQGALTMPEVPRGYDKESFYEGLNYLHINLKTGRLWLTDKVNVGRYRQWRD